MDNGRAVIVTVVAVGLAIGLLAALPGRAPATAGGHRAAPSPPTTTAPPASGSSTTTSTTAADSGPVLHVAVLAPYGAPAVSATEAKLTTAHVLLTHEAAIPSSWVSSLTSPIVHYPYGLDSEALRVASILGIPASSVSEESSGTSDGAQVVEVFLPAS
jgi:hypothetical protein